MVWARGPATKRPMGAKANDPNASYEPTRDRASSGTFVCKVVIQFAYITSTATPVPMAVTKRIHSGAESPVASIQAAPMGITPTAISNGRWGLKRNANAVPRMLPTPNPNIIVPIARAPSNSSFMCTGASTAMKASNAR